MRSLCARLLSVTSRLAAFGLVLATGASSAPGAVFTVDRFDDPPGGTSSCVDTVPDDCSLRGAVHASNGTAGTDTIAFPPGSYLLTIPGSGEDGNVEGDLDHLDPDGAILRATAAGGVVLEQTAGDRLLDARPGSGPLTVEGVALLGGTVTGHGGTVRAGGALLRLERAVVSRGRATGTGGCVHRDASGSLEVEESGFLGCRAGGLGGGIYARLPADSSIRRSWFEDCVARSGGAVWISDGAMSIEDTVFRGNAAEDATSSSGGALGSNGAALGIERSTFWANRAGQAGASVATGGALYLGPTLVGPPTGTFPTVATLRNVTLAGNRVQGATARGAGIFLSLSEADLIHATILDSRTAGEHSLEVDGAGSILDLGSSAIDGGCLVTGGGTVQSSLYNVEQPWDGTTTSTCGLGSGDQVVTGLKIGPPAIHGGPWGVPTARPDIDGAPASPVLSFVPSTHCSAVDARTAPRALLFCDAGAHETSGEPPGPWLFADGFESGDTAAWSSTQP